MRIIRFDGDSLQDILDTIEEDSVVNIIQYNGGELTYNKIFNLIIEANYHSFSKISIGNGSLTLHNAVVDNLDISTQKNCSVVGSQIRNLNLNNAKVLFDRCHLGEINTIQTGIMFVNSNFSSGISNSQNSTIEFNNCNLDVGENSIVHSTSKLRITMIACNVNIKHNNCFFVPTDSFITLENTAINSYIHSGHDFEIVSGDSKGKIYFNTWVLQVNTTPGFNNNFQVSKNYDIDESSEYKIYYTSGSINYVIEQNLDSTDEIIFVREKNSRLDTDHGKIIYVGNCNGKITLQEHVWKGIHKFRIINGSKYTLTLEGNINFTNRIILDPGKSIKLYWSQKDKQYLS